VTPATPLPQYNTSAETVTITIGGGLAPASLHVWVTQLGWDGMAQTNSSYFQPAADLPVVNGAVTVQVPVDAIITLTTVASRTWRGLMWAPAAMRPPLRACMCL
jgi:hypothetical protein